MELDYTKYPDVPPGYRLNENKRAGLYQVYRDIWKEDPATGTKRIFRETIGSIRGGKFHPSDTYLLRKELEELRKDNEDLRSRLALLPKSSEETGRQAEQVQAQVCQSIEKSRIDARRQDFVQVPMSSIVLSSVMCSLGGDTDAAAISDWARTHRDFFKRYLPGEKVESITHDVVERALMVVDTGKFDAFYTEMTAPLIRLTANRIVAVDGQAVRATGRRSREDGAMHGAKMLLNVYDTDNRVCLSHQLIDKKANEISVGFKMIEKLSLPGSIVTADAMNCQVKFAEAVLNAQADYLLSLKGNQDRSWQEVIALFAETDDSQVKKYKDGIDLAHGRIESREISVLPGRLMSAPFILKWPGLACGSVVRERSTCTYKSTGKESKPRYRYFITSISPHQNYVARIYEAIRAHWGIENNLHYVLDVYWRQDAISAKNPCYIANRSALAKLALAFLEHYSFWLWNTGRSEGNDPLPIRTLQARCRKPEVAIECLAAGLGFI